MNSLILKNSTGLIDNPHILAHLHTTLKSKVNDTLKCTILNQGLATGEILHLTPDECHLKLSPLKPGHAPWFNLAIGLSRPQTSKKILEHGTTFGAQSFHFFKASLSEKSYLDSKIFENKAYEDYLLAGLSQSGIYANMPSFTLSKYNPAQTYAASSGNKFILDLNGAKSFEDYRAEINFDHPVTLALGPERGFIPEDITPFHQAGFKSVKLSASILRVEHALYAAVSQLEMLRGRY